MAPGMITLYAARKRIQARARNGETALMKAASEGYDSCVQQLVEAGADVNLNDNESTTALMHAALAGKDGCLSALLESGADVNRANEKGDTALSLVVLSESENFIKCFEILIAAGADVNMYKNTYTKPPLVIATEHNHLYYVERLLKAGADVDLDGYEPLYCAAGSGSVECVKLFLQKGIRAEFVQDCLYRAVLGGHVECLKSLIEAGANVNCATEHRSPLMIAAANGDIWCVSILLEAGADVNYRTICNSTAIMKAAENGHRRCVSALLEAGADGELCEY